MSEPDFIAILMEMADKYIKINIQLALSDQDCPKVRAYQEIIRDDLIARTGKGYDLIPAKNLHVTLHKLYKSREYLYNLRKIFKDYYPVISIPCQDTNLVFTEYANLGKLSFLGITLGNTSELKQLRNYVLSTINVPIPPFSPHMIIGKNAFEAPPDEISDDPKFTSLTFNSLQFDAFT